jgi:hypothetical protein
VKRGSPQRRRAMPPILEEAPLLSKKKILKVERGGE